MNAGLGWGGIARLGVVQAAIGSIVVLATSTLNRVMVVELALPAVFPGLLVALHYAVQMARTRVGHGSDVGGRLTSWIVGGMLVLAVGGVGAASSVALLTVSHTAGMIAAIAAYTVIGLGVGACGTSLLVLLAKSVDAARRPAAATITWVMMFVGFVITTAIAGQLLDPYSPARLVAVVAAVSLADVIITALAIRNMEARMAGRAAVPRPTVNHSRSVGFREALAQVWRERQARHFTIFVFVSMLAYSGQELLLEPFVARVFQLSPGQSARIASLQHGGALVGMVLVAVLGTWLLRRRPVGLDGRAGNPSMRAWTTGGCMASAVALAGLVIAALSPAVWPLRENVFVLGVANGVFAVSAIGSMMSLVSAGGPERQGLRMGLWGAAQATAFAVGGALSSAAVDVATQLFSARPPAYAVVFGAQTILFVCAGIVAARIRSAAAPSPAIIQHSTQSFDAVVVGGGPAGSTAAADLARRGHKVLLLDRAGRIKPCGGAIPPKLVEEFEIPGSLLVARVTGARMVSPASQRVDMPIDGGYVGMVDREIFDEWLRERARLAGCVRRSGVFESLKYDSEGSAVIRIKQDDAEIRARVVVGADGAQSAVARQCMPSVPRPPYVAAYHEIVQRPVDYDTSRCDVFYQGELSPDFYAWIFPHGETLSVGVGSAQKGFSLRRAVDVLRQRTGLDLGETVRCEGAPIPLRPLRRWDDGRRVVLAGDAAGVVAPASGEGIYYAMAGGRYAADAADAFLSTGQVSALRTARRRFMKAHGKVFFILGILQRFWYSSDGRRERFVSICKDPDVQRLTWEAYMHKRLTRSRPVAHIRIFFKDLMHLLGVART